MREVGSSLTVFFLRGSGLSGVDTGTQVRFLYHHFYDYENKT